MQRRTPMHCLIYAGDYPPQWKSPLRLPDSEKLSLSQCFYAKAAIYYSSLSLFESYVRTFRLFSHYTSANCEWSRWSIMPWSSLYQTCLDVVCGDEVGSQHITTEQPPPLTWNTHKPSKCFCVSKCFIQSAFAFQLDFNWHFKVLLHFN